MKIGKIELTQAQFIIAVIAGIAVGAIVIYVLFYTPLIRELRMKYIECKAIEADALDARNIIESAGKVYGERVLTSEEDVSQAMDELTKHGRVKGINFISINPEEIKKEKGTQYKIVPVKMEIESDYEKLGIFLGSLDDLKKGLVKVKKFDITSDKEDPSKLLTDLVVDVYLSGK